MALLSFGVASQELVVQPHHDRVPWEGRKRRMVRCQTNFSSPSLGTGLMLHIIVLMVHPEARRSRVATWRPDHHVRPCQQLIPWCRTRTDRAFEVPWK